MESATDKTATVAKLTRAEAAYLYLADFAKGADVIVSDSPGRRSGTVTTPQRGDPADAYLTVRMDGSGEEIWIGVAGLLSGEYQITGEDDAMDGYWPRFDEAGYAMQNGQA